MAELPLSPIVRHLLQDVTKDDANHEQLKTAASALLAGCDVNQADLAALHLVLGTSVRKLDKDNSHVSEALEHYRTACEIAEDAPELTGLFIAGCAGMATCHISMGDRQAALRDITDMFRVAGDAMRGRIMEALRARAPRDLRDRSRRGMAATYTGLRRLGRAASAAADAFAETLTEDDKAQ